jgi:hypothetical protein
MRLLAILGATVGAALMLSGCAVLSEKPLFGPADAAPHPLSDGLWAMSSPGCEVHVLAPGERLPDCALPIEIHGDRMVFNMNDMLGRFLDEETAAKAKESMDKAQAGKPKISDVRFMLVPGDPAIVQFESPAATKTTPFGTVGAGYMTVRVVETRPSGEIARAIIWTTSCPKKLSMTKLKSLEDFFCVAKSLEEVRKHTTYVPLLASWYFTWVSKDTPAHP